ncbi:hypothetical protein HanRHA438_Chr13g0623101 [Helianthus annuus]|nr:hypothetical protein HanRHA438_Chr13g0623101 [Helianthus annuus]
MLPMVHRTINSPTMSSTHSGTQTLQLHHDPTPPPVGPTQSPSLFHMFAPKTLLAAPNSDPHNHLGSLMFDLTEVNVGTTRNDGHSALKHVLSPSLGLH